MSRSVLAVVLIAILGDLSSFNSAHAELVGNDVSQPRTTAVDPFSQSLYLYANSPIAKAGHINAFAIFDQVGTSGRQNNAYVLRPSGNNDYLVLSENLIVSTGSGTTKFFPITPISVMPDDIIAHFGTGIPFTIGSSLGDSYQIIYASAGVVAPIAGNMITVPSSSYPIFLTGGYRDYALAANFVPEPCSAALYGVVLIGITGTRVTRKRVAPTLDCEGLVTCRLA
jgi:hypothetical protein